MENTEDPLAHLDFPLVTTCDMKRVAWAPSGLPPDEVVSANLNPDGCQSPATMLVALRLCPCWNDPRDRVALGEAVEDIIFLGGLTVTKTFMCDTHRDYFTSLSYPFICAGCGVYFPTVAEILLAKRDL